jgi:putative iron-regulated protein
MLTSLVLVLACSLLTGEVVAGAGSGGVQKTEVVAHYARLVSAVYEDSLTGAEGLQKRVAEFLAKPSEANLKAAREAWIAARKPYLQSEAFRFCEGPVDQMEGRINSWPIDENYID